MMPILKCQSNPHSDTLSPPSASQKGWNPFTDNARRERIALAEVQCGSLAI